MNSIRHLFSRSRAHARPWGFAGALLVTGLLLTPATTLALQVKVLGSYPGYVSFGPSLIVNLASDRSPKFMRVEIEFYILDMFDGDAVRQFGPAIRDRLITLYGGRDMESLQTVEGREALRKETLEQLRETLLRLSGRPAIEDLYFTSFIMQ